MAVQHPQNTNSVSKISNRNGYFGMPIAEIIKNGFFTVDRKWIVRQWNRAAEELLGVNANDIVGKNLWEKFAGVIPLNFYTNHHKAFLQDAPVYFEEYWGEMGSWFDVITYHSEDILSVSFKSASQRVQPEQPQKVLTQLYQFISEVTNSCLWEWDLRAREQFWVDGGHKKIFGYQIENALIPQSFWESRIHPYDKARVLSKLNKVVKEGSQYTWEDEYRFQKADGDYAYVHDRGHIIYNADSKQPSRMVGATQDISTRKLAEILLKSGLELMDDKKSVLTRKIKSVIIELAHFSDEPLTIKFSEFLSQKLNHDYTYLANIFSEVQGTTIEKFFIAHKIERVKELLLYDEMNLTKIAYLMHYSSVAHLSSQFKKVTGLTPSHFKQLREKKRSMQKDV